MTEITKTTPPIDDVYSVLENVLIRGDISALSVQEKMEYLEKLCSSLGLNPLTRPFEYTELKGGKLILYARKDATDQLRRMHKVSITKLVKSTVNDVFIVEAYAQAGDGRVDVATGAVSLKSWGKALQGDDLANAIMKAETKAKRRVTLSIVGLGCLDETELETIPIRSEKAISSSEAIVPLVEPAILETKPHTEQDIHEAFTTLDDLAAAPIEPKKPIVSQKGEFIIDGKHCYPGALYNKYLDKVMVCETEAEYNKFVDWKESNKEAIIAYGKQFKVDYTKLHEISKARMEICKGK